jgi:glycosyltransferase involved in cell wall biosynthesis
VGTLGGGIPEFVDDGVTGRLVARGSASELASALIELLRDLDKRTRMGREGRARVEAAFTWEHVAERVRSLLTGEASS